MDSNKTFPTTQILLNGNNYDKASNSFIYTFNSDQPLLNHVIGMQSCVLYNQFYNISASIGNNKVTYYHPSGASAYVSQEITIDDGYYDSPETFSTYLQAKLLSYKFYTAPTTTTSKYFLEMGSTATQYAFYLKLYTVSSTDTPINGSAWTAVTSPRTPKISFGKCGTVWGFDPATIYDGVAATKTINSPIAPQIRDSTTIIFTCNVCHNGGISFPSDFLYSLRIGNAFGSAITNLSQEVVFQKIQPATYRQIVIRLYDQNMKSLPILDSNVMFLLLLRQNTKAESK